MKYYCVMEFFIHKYLTRNYEVSTTEESSKKITLTINWGVYHRHIKNSWGKQEIQNSELLRELVKIFGGDVENAKICVNSWAKSINSEINLTEYWNKINSILPIARQIAATTIGLDLVSIQPMSGPKGNLLFLDYEYQTPYNHGGFHQEIIISSGK